VSLGGGVTEPALNGGKAKSLVGDKSVLNGVLPKPQQEVEVGVSMFLPFVTPYKDAWEVLKDDEISTAQLVAMRKTDGQARALYRLITLPIRAALATSTFVPPSGVDGGEEETLFVQNMLTLPASGGGMSTPLNRVVAQMLMAVFDGFSPFEIVYWVPKFGPLKDKWAIKKLAYRPSKSITFLLDNNGDAVGFRQRTFHMGRSVDVEIPSNAFVYYAAQEEERPFYGQSFFQSAFYHYDKKVRLYYIAHLAAQRSAMGTRIGKLPAAPTRDEKEAFKKALADMGIAQWIALPDQYDIQTIKEGGNFDFLAYINHHNSQMSKSVLANFFDDQQGSGGDTTLVDFGRQSDALYMMMLDTIISEIETVFNNAIIPRFIDWNFGSGKYPKFKLGQLTAEQKAAMVDMFKSLSAVSSANQGCTPEFMMALEKQVSEEFGLEIDYEAVEERVTEEKQQQADLASQQF
jgi:hypothetical protein